MRWLALLTVTLLVSVPLATAQDPPPVPDPPSPPAPPEPGYVPPLPPLPDADDPTSWNPDLPGSGEDIVGIVYTWLPPGTGFQLPTIKEGSADPDAGPQDHMHVAWNDAAHATAVARDGYDLRSLAVWEYDHEAQGGGIMLRLAMDGGRLTGGAERYIVAMEIGIDGANGTSLAWQSLDGGMTWAGSGAVVDVNVSMKDANEAGAIKATVMHIHVPYAAISAAPGMNLTGFQAWTWTQARAETEEVAIDIAPGGAYLAGDVTEVPEADGDGAELSSTAPAAPPYYLRGAGRHIQFAGAWSQDVAALQFGNPYNLDQELRVASPPGFAPRSADGVSADGSLAIATLPANGTITIVYDVPRQSQSQQLTWFARSDTGGIAEMQAIIPALPPPPVVPTTTTAPPVEPEPEVIPVQRTDKVLAPPKPPAPASEEESDPEGEDSPAGAWIVGVGVLAAVALRRRP